jgi:hypothetical protein
MRLLPCAAAALVLLAHAASAQVPLLGSEGIVTPPASYTGPGDIVSGASAWYSCTRAYDAAQASAGVNACTIRRASDNTTTTLTTQSNGAVQSGASFCSGTTCCVFEMYDQTGNGWNVSQNGQSDQFTYNPSGGPNGGAYLSGSSSCCSLIGSSFTPATGKVTLNAYFAQTATAASALILTENSSLSPNALKISTNIPPLWRLIANAANPVNTGNLVVSTWYSFTGVIASGTNGCVINVNGTETTGTQSTLSTTAGDIEIVGADSPEFTEMGFWDNVVFTSTQRTNLYNNQSAYY